MLPDTASTHGRTRAAGASTTGGHQPDEEHPGHPDKDPAGPLTAAATALASLSRTARQGSMDTTAALAAITAARSLAAELEHSELAFTEAARGSGATWSQIAAAMGARNRQTAQKRHADLARRFPRPPAADTPATPEPQQQASRDASPANTDDHRTGDSPAPARPAKPAWHRGRDRHRRPPGSVPAAADTAGPSPDPPARMQRKQPLPKITSAIIAETQYELVRAPGHQETRAWHVLVDGKRVGLVRPTWQRERSRPGWEPVDNTGLALPATGIGRTTPTGHARTRDAAAVSLLHALQRQQENDHKRKPSP